MLRFVLPHFVKYPKLCALRSLLEGFGKYESLGLVCLVHY